MTGILHPAKDPSTDATGSVIPAQIMSAVWCLGVHPAIKHILLRRQQKQHNGVLDSRTVYQSHMCSASGKRNWKHLQVICDLISAAFTADMRGKVKKINKKKATVKFLLAKQIQAFLSNLKAGGAKWRVSRWRHSFKEGSKQRCLWKCGWNGALKSCSLYVPTYYTHEGTFSASRIHAGHFGLYRQLLG